LFEFCSNFVRILFKSFSWSSWSGGGHHGASRQWLKLIKMEEKLKFYNLIFFFHFKSNLT
jgi:hypothetical protein